jgi:hypothetical protein
MPPPDRHGFAHSTTTCSHTHTLTVCPLYCTGSEQLQPTNTTAGGATAGWNSRCDVTLLQHAHSPPPRIGPAFEYRSVSGLRSAESIPSTSICKRHNLQSSTFRFPNRILYLYTVFISPILATCPTHRILLDFIFLIFGINSTNYAAPHCTVFSSLLSLACP